MRRIMGVLMQKGADLAKIKSQWRQPLLTTFVDMPNARPKAIVTWSEEAQVPSRARLASAGPADSDEDRRPFLEALGRRF